MPKNVVDPTKYQLGKGKVFFDRFDDNGDKTGEYFVGDTETFDLTPSDERLPEYSSATASAAKTADALIRRNYELKASMKEHHPENLALLLMGEVSALSVTGSTVTDEAHDSVKEGYYVPLAYRKVSIVTVTDDATPTPETFTETDDYIIDAATGRIYIVPAADGGSIATGTNLLVSYTYAADSSTVIKAGTKSEIQGFVRFVGDNSVGDNYEGQIWKVSVNPTGTLSMIQTQWGRIEITLQVLDDSANHPGNPFFQLIAL